MFPVGQQSKEEAPGRGGGLLFCLTGAVGGMYLKALAFSTDSWYHNYWKRVINIVKYMDKNTKHYLIIAL